MLAARAAGIRVKLDDRDHVRPGAKFYEWELKGVPLRFELGARDLAEGRVTLARRDGEGRQVLPLDAAAAAAPGLLGEIQQRLYDQALDFRERHTARLDDRAALLEYLAEGRGFAVTAWCGSDACEADVKAETSASIRCLSLEVDDPGAACAVCGRPGTETATWAQAY